MTETEPVGPAFQVIEGNGDTVSMLESFLAKAKSGYVTSVALAATTEKGGVMTAWSRPPYGKQVALIGSLDHLKYRLNRNLDESSD